ncbi:MAG: S-layer homology domain-containing protein, partial [Clostridia bacterium]
MKAKKTLALLLSVAMTMSLVSLPALAAGEENAVPISAPKVEFSDTANHWAASAITRWSNYGVINGYGDGTFLPDGELTRAELASIIVNVLGLSRKVDGIPYADLAGTEWYADAVLKCTAANIVGGDGTNFNATRNISREEATVMMARALGVAEIENPNLSAFADGSSVSDWAAGYVAAMAESGVIQGVGNKTIAPKININRASIVTILDKAIATYINAAGTYSESTTGLAVVSTSDVILKNAKITGNLLVAEGVGDGDLTLDNTSVTGKMIARGGGVNSIYIIGNSAVTDLSIARQDGAVRVVTSGGGTVSTVVVDDGRDDVIIEGTFNKINVASETPVTLKNADVKSVVATVANASLTVDKASKVATVATDVSNTTVNVQGTVTTVAATVAADGMNVNVSATG